MGNFINYRSAKLFRLNIVTSPHFLEMLIIGTRPTGYFSLVIILTFSSLLIELLMTVVKNIIVLFC